MQQETHKLNYIYMKQKNTWVDMAQDDAMIIYCIFIHSIR